MIRYPNIQGANPAEQLAQTKSYLHQLVQQLNVALEDTDRRMAAVSAPANPSVQEKQEQAAATFQSIKALIIKSADIVNAYYDEVCARLEGVYVAESAFGSYAEETAQQIRANSTSLQSLFTNIQAIATDVAALEHYQVETNAHINAGLLYYTDAGVPVYGLEIGQRNKLDGVEVFHKYARFTADKLSFYDSNNNEVAFVSDRKLHITAVEVLGQLIRGGLTDIVQPDGTVVSKWTRA